MGRFLIDDDDEGERERLENGKMVKMNMPSGGGGQNHIQHNK